MLGTIVNAVAIIAGSITGLLFSRGIPEHYKVTVQNGVGLSVVMIGVKSALVADNLLVVIISIVAGALCGEIARIENRLEQLGTYLETIVAGKNGGNTDNTFAKGFVTASLVFCVGSMAIVGSLESGLTGNHQTLFAKSVLDGVTSIIFASTMGLGVIFSAVAVFLYQGAITLTAVFMKGFLVPATVQEMTSTGGLLILAIGLNMLGMTRIRVGNMLPAIFMPLLYFAVRQWLS